MNYDEIKAAWNAQADEHNQWDDLGEDEKIEWAASIAAAKERAARIRAQEEVVALKERIARAGVEQRRAVSEAVQAVPVVTSAEQSRAEFEAWRIKRIRSATGRHPSTHTDLELRAMFLGFDHAAGEYTSAHEQHRWEAWQAAREVVALEYQARELLECAGCGHLYEVPGVSACCCGDNPRNEYTGWVAVPTESTPDPRRAADADNAWSLHP